MAHSSEMKEIKAFSANIDNVTELGCQDNFAMELGEWRGNYKVVV